MSLQDQIEQVASQMNLGPERDQDECWTGGLQTPKIALFRDGFVVVQPFFHNFRWGRQIFGDRHENITAVTARFRTVAMGGGLSFSYFSHVTTQAEGEVIEDCQQIS